MKQWMPGSTFDHLDKFANSLGYEYADIALMLSFVPWQSTDERDDFIRSITGSDPVGGTKSIIHDTKGGAM